MSIVSIVIESILTPRLIIKTRTKYFDEFHGYVKKKYLEQLIEDPGRIEKIVREALNDRIFIKYLAILGFESLRYSEEFLEKMPKVLNELRRKLRSLGENVGEAVELVIEHDYFKIKNFPEFLGVWLDFIYEYPEDAVEYAKIYIGSLLLLSALLELLDKGLIKKELINQFTRYAEELDSYTDTFYLMLKREKITGDKEYIIINDYGKLEDLFKEV
ncbi:MAG: hypothetical protein B6U89_01590 [Desulfurococcales archaeon ex4484_58]|nr:MAG: hypothetical protein B6U89_01590 [Desulfurococcales archaeon ex4484_58]